MKLLIQHHLLTIVWILVVKFSDMFAGYTTVLELQKGCGVSLFQMWEITNVECGSTQSGFYRSNLTDLPVDLSCVTKAGLILDANGPGLPYYINLITPTTDIDSWFVNSTVFYNHGEIKGINQFDTRTQDFDVVFYQPGTTLYDRTMFVIHFPQNANVVKPRFYYADIANQSIYDESGHLNFSSFREAQTLVLQYDIDFTKCSPVTVSETYDSCVDAVANHGLCPCSCDYRAKIDYWEAYLQNKTHEELVEEATRETEIIKQELKRNVSELTSFKNKRISASDPRQSAQNLGALGAAILSFVVALLVICDVMPIKKHCKGCTKNQ